MYLVTGGAGFIGSNLVAALVQQGKSVVVCDWLGSGDKWRNLARHELEDIIPPEKMKDYLSQHGERISAVFHMGAISATTETNADALMDNNFRLSKTLWNICATRRIPFIYASSAATYGGGEGGFDDDQSIEHLAKLLPLNGYGWSKQLFDRWVARRIANNAPQPPQWAGLKFFNVYGPNEYHKEGQASVPYHLFKQITTGEPARLFQSHHPDYPDGGQLRDFISVDDCINVMLWLKDNRKVSGLFNVGTGQARTFSDLARAVFAAMDKNENIKYVPTPEAIRDKYQYFTEANMDKLKAAGYDRPFLTLEEGVTRYIQEHLARENAYR
ncbi:ADP-glyceromanno-heptose 6-epimerase [Kiloniella laminariae]|uniref:ADP-L-glycero-D-manno-heptose-6-epimerase n=1 Tax=Kiloniella laminariae TaxID=454162 RepID=A0ABT4LLB7_9PROT|nr:ADP-glyceromanno-heptose 6-epimerase [Kiloniella laminariae]MCZ4281864.1 ADP-glyceromanno-heptose 6-epimerase [Kiloniella laminariae]